MALEFSVWPAGSVARYRAAARTIAERDGVFNSRQRDELAAQVRIGDLEGFGDDEVDEFVSLVLSDGVADTVVASVGRPAAESAQTLHTLLHLLRHRTAAALRELHDRRIREAVGGSGLQLDVASLWTLLEIHGRNAASGSATAEDTARRHGIPAEVMKRVFDEVAREGLVAEGADGRYALTQVGAAGLHELGIVSGALRRTLAPSTAPDQIGIDSVPPALRDETPARSEGSGDNRFKAATPRSRPNSVPGSESRDPGLRVGDTLSNRYRLTRHISTGGLGVVWEGLDTRLGRQVAVKVLKQEFSSDPEFIERFGAEARTVAMLNHPGIASVYDYGAVDFGAGANAYLVAELINGEPLNAVFKRVGSLSLRHTLDMLEQTGRALQAAHGAGSVHRDVKPGNILITPTGRVKITDFGVAKAVARDGVVVGAAQYLAPEQALGRDATAASDAYSLGVVGYESLSGRRPFAGDSALTVAMKHIKEQPPALPSTVPPNVRELIEIALQKDPRLRYRTGGAFADAVAVVRSGRRPPRP